MVSLLSLFYTLPRVDMVTLPSQIGVCGAISKHHPGNRFRTLCAREQRGAATRDPRAGKEEAHSEGVTGELSTAPEPLGPWHLTTFLFL